MSFRAKIPSHHGRLLSSAATYRNQDRQLEVVANPFIYPPHGTTGLRLRYRRHFKKSRGRKKEVKMFKTPTNAKNFLK